MIDKLHHYSMTHPASIYDEEALTALELAGRTAGKMNEVIEDHNKLRSDVEKSIPVEVYKEVQKLLKEGAFDKQINESLGNLEERVDSLVGSTVAGSTTLDLEVIDMRTGADGTHFSSAGESLRNALAMGNLVDETNYATKMPDLNNVMTPSVHVLHFANGSKDIPKNMPFTEWDGRIGVLFTIKGTYYRQIYIDDRQILTRNGTRVDNWSAWRPLNKPEYVIDINGNGDYSSILKGLKAHPTNTRFIIMHGEYDVIQMYHNVYGADYFAIYGGYAGSKDNFDRGLFLGDGTELIGCGFVELIFDYKGENPDVKKFFSVLNTSQNNHVENIGITIADDSCRYLIHDDFATEGGTNVFKSLTLKGYSHLGTSIGGGFGLYNNYAIEGCHIFGTNESIAIAYHNNANESKNRLFVKDCFCDGSIRLRHYGASSQKSKAVVTNCKATKIVLEHGDATTFPNENIELKEWNNVTNGDYVTPEMYGAKHDGETDDAQAFEEALNSGYPVKLIRGSKPYAIKSPVTITIDGASMYSDMVWSSENKFSNINITGQGQFIVNGEYFVARNVYAYSGVETAFTLNGKNNLDVDANFYGCVFSGGTTGVICNGRGLKVEHCLFARVTTAIKLNYQGTTTGTGDITTDKETGGRGFVFTNNRYHTNVLFAVDVLGGSNVVEMLYHGNLSDHHGAGIKVNGSLRNAVISNNIFANCNNDTINIGANATFENITISDNEFNSKQTTGLDYCNQFFVASAGAITRGITFMGNNFNGTKYRAIGFLNSAVSDLVIANNHFENLNMTGNNITYGAICLPPTTEGAVIMGNIFGHLAGTVAGCGVRCAGSPVSLKKIVVQNNVKIHDKDYLCHTSFTSSATDSLLQEYRNVPS